MASERDLSPLWPRAVGSDLVRLAAAKRAVIGTAVSAAEAICVVLQSGRDRRHAGEGAGPPAAAYANRKILALCRRPAASSGGLRLYAHAGTRRTGKLPG